MDVLDANKYLDKEGLAQVWDLIKQYVWDKSPIVKGDVENSAVLKNLNNTAISEGSVALGKDNIVGLKGFYYKYITLKAGGQTRLANVYLSKTQVSNPTISTVSGASYKDTSIKPQNYWAVGDIVSIVNDAKYDDIATVVQIKDGLIQIEWLDEKSPFSTVKPESDLSPEDYSIYCLDKPTQGISDLGKYSFANGIDNKAINIYTEVSGKGNVAKGKFAKVWGKNNVGGYNTTTFGTNNMNLADNSLVNGTNNINEGNNSVIHGNANENYGKRAFVVGNQNITYNENEAAFGKYNKSENDTQFSIGVGTSDTDRKNAFEVKQNGDIYVYDYKLATGCINITHSELKTLRDNSQLIPGQQYRIADYVTTTTQKDTISAEHPFDIIVTADSENTLNENARAIQHEGDEYFKDCDLAAWEIKYSVENSAKYAWAAPANGQIQTLLLNIFGNSGKPIRVSSSDMHIDNIDYYCWKIETNDFHAYTDTLNPTSETTLFSPEFIGYENGKDIYEMVVIEDAYFENVSMNITPGKGVIYYMKDEWGNELPYDFKNIVYKKDSKRVKVIIEYDYNDRFRDKNAELVYSDDRDIIIYDDALEKDIKYYAWRVFDTDGIASGICYTQIPYDCITPSTTFYEYIPPTEEEVKAYIESMSLVEGIAEGIGGDKPLIGIFSELTNISIISIENELKQYTFGDEYSDISDITDYSLNTVESRSVKNNIIKPLISNGKYTLNGNVFTGANNNIVLNNCPKVDKSSLTYETAKDIKNTDDTEFAKVYGADRDKSEAMESYEMGYNDTKNACLEALGYGYGSGGSGGSGSSFVVDIPTGNFHYDTYLTPMEVAFANANGDKLITNNLSTVPADYEPIGVVVIPASHDVYGTGECGVISLIESGNVSIISNTGDLGIDPQYRVFITQNTSSDDMYYSGATDGYLPSDDFNGQQSYVDPKSYYKFNDLDKYMMSPYLGEEKNDKYVGGSSESVTYSFDGKERTNILSSYNPEAVTYCLDYNTIGTQKNDWYLPTVAELGYAMVRKKSINNTLDIIKSYFGIDTMLLLRTYMTSTIYNHNYKISFDSGIVYCDYTAPSYWVRPMYCFKP